ncbi:MAG: thermonuclease family protein [Xanthobacteraceae bacterium]
MGGWALLIGAGVTIGAALGASARDAGFPCGGDLIATGRVAKIHDGRSFALENGRDVRIAALEVPPPDDRSQGTAARVALQSLLAGQTVELRSAGTANSDRYGRTVAHVYLVGAAAPSGPRSAGHAMLAGGFGRVGADVDNRACAKSLLSQERVARAAKLGLWTDPRYAILDARSLAALLARQGRFALAEGKVASVRTSGGTIYVNFGRRWSQALTVTISKRRERIFAGAGMALKELENRPVRVRGWIEVRNDPRMEAQRPQQIEIAGLN